MKAKFKCLKCNYFYEDIPGPTQCPKCGYLYIKWLNYEEWREWADEQGLDNWYYKGIKYVKNWC